MSLSLVSDVCQQLLDSHKQQVSLMHLKLDSEQEGQETEPEKQSKHLKH